MQFKRSNRRVAFNSSSARHDHNTPRLWTEVQYLFTGLRRAAASARTTRRVRFAGKRRTFLPLPKEEGRGEGEVTLETPMRWRTGLRPAYSPALHTGCARRITGPGSSCGVGKIRPHLMMRRERNRWNQRGRGVTRRKMKDLEKMEWGLFHLFRRAESRYSNYSFFGWGRRLGFRPGWSLGVVTLSRMTTREILGRCRWPAAGLPPRCNGGLATP